RRGPSMSAAAARTKTADKVKDDLYRLRHSLAHVMAQAVQQIRPGAKLAFGPPVENGFYYDFDLSGLEPITDKDFPEIEKGMRKIINQDQQFSVRALPADEAAKMLEERGEVYKVEHAQKLKNSGEKEITFWKNGPFDDLCEGPHVPSTKSLPVKGFAIDRTSGAYWLGDETRPSLTRIYGLAFH